jgi:RNA polymerase sigma factor (sigma-70 family)
MTPPDENYINELAGEALIPLGGTTLWNEPLVQELFQLVFRRLLGYLRKLTKEPYESCPEAEDLIQETWLRIFPPQLDPLRPKYDAHRPFIHFALWHARKAWLDWERKKRRQLTTGFLGGWDAEGQDPQPNDELVFLEYLARFPECLERLTLQKQEIWGMRQEQNLSHQEIADKLQIPVGTVRGRYFEAVQELLACVMSSAV